MDGELLDNKLLLDDRINELVLQKLRQIDSFNFDWKEGFKSRDKRELQELKKIASIASVGSSTRIEGVLLTDLEISDLIQNLDINKLKKRDEEEVVGYYEALDLIFSEYKALDLTESNIKYLHNLLLKYSSKDLNHKGKYKTVDNKVVAKYPDGLSKVIFQTTEPFLVEKEMSELVDWARIKLEDTNYHPIIIIAVFTYEFLSIHPFQDGNGRLSRLISNLLLMREGYLFIEYKSFEHVIEERKKDYYKVLMDAQKNRSCHEEDLSLWIIFFLDSIVTLTERLEAPVFCLSSGVNGLNDRQEKILKITRENGKTRISKISEVLPEIPRPTLSLDLAHLVRDGFLVKHGKSRGTYYTVNE